MSALAPSTAALVGSLRCLGSRRGHRPIPNAPSWARRRRRSLLLIGAVKPGFPTSPLPDDVIEDGEGAIRTFRCPPQRHDARARSGDVESHAVDARVALDDAGARENECRGCVFRRASPPPMPGIGWSSASWIPGSTAGTRPFSAGRTTRRRAASIPCGTCRRAAAIPVETRDRREQGCVQVDELRQGVNRRGRNTNHHAEFLAGWQRRVHPRSRHARRRHRGGPRVRDVAGRRRPRRHHRGRRPRIGRWLYQRRRGRREILLPEGHRARHAVRGEHQPGHRTALARRHRSGCRSR